MDRFPELFFFPELFGHAKKRKLQYSSFYKLECMKLIALLSNIVHRYNFNWLLKA